MSYGIFAAFWAVSILFVITPGVDWAYAISAGMRGRTVVPAVAGLLIGHLLATLVVAAGVGALVAGHPLTLTALTVVGAGYLLWVGIGMLRHPAVPSAAEIAESGSWARWAVKGVCVSGLNPKVSCCSWPCCPSSRTAARRGRCRCRSLRWGWFTSSVAAWSICWSALAPGRYCRPARGRRCSSAACPVPR